MPIGGGRRLAAPLLLAVFCLGCERGGLSQRLLQEFMPEPPAAPEPAAVPNAPDAARPEPAPAAVPPAAEAVPTSAPAEAPADEVSYPATTVFRYTDGGGDLHFVTGIHNVPPAYRRGVQVVDGGKLSTYRSSTATVARAAPQAAGEPLRGKASGAWNEAQIDWIPHDRAVTTARRLGHPVCVIIYTEWCHVCKDYKNLFKDPALARRAKDLVMVRVNSDLEPEVAQRYQPDGAYVPRTLFLSPEGKLDPDLRAHGGRHGFVYSVKAPTSLLAGMDRALERYR